MGGSVERNKACLEAKGPMQVAGRRRCIRGVRNDKHLSRIVALFAGAKARDMHVHFVEVRTQGLFEWRVRVGLLRAVPAGISPGEQGAGVPYVWGSRCTGSGRRLGHLVAPKAVRARGSMGEAQGGRAPGRCLLHGSKSAASWCRTAGG